MATDSQKPHPWPGGIIPYDITALAAEQQQKAQQAMKRWTDTGAQIQFVPRTNETEYVHFTGKIDAGNNTSHTGFKKGARSEINITAFWWRQAEWMPAHELGHVLGFQHEHQRWDRDAAVTIHYENIKPGRAHDYDWIPQTNWLVTSTAYDYRSIMHYRVCWTSANESECRDGDGSSPSAVIDPIGTNYDNVIGQWDANGISATDAEELRLVYGTKSAPQTNAPKPSVQGSSTSTLVEVPVASAKALRFYHTGNVLFSVRIAWGLLIPALFVFTGLSARVRSWADCLGRRWYFSFVLYCGVVVTLYYLANLPLSYYASFVRPHEFDLSNQTFGKWFGDSFKGFVLLLGGMWLVGWIPFLLLKKSPRRWWLYAGGVAVLLILFAQLITPVVIAPLFNKFQPLQDRALETKILALASLASIEGSRVFEVDKSVDTKTVNAYVTGFMGTKRIVFWDTALRTLDEPELLGVLGHEMGHYVLGHVMQRVAYACGFILLVLYLAHRCSDRFLVRFRQRLGFDKISDIAALPLAVLYIQLVSLLASPAELALSRYQEHEADRFALELTHDNHAFASAFLKLQQHNLSNPRPGPFFQFWRGSHPPIGDRIDFCNSYRPWEAGEPSRYEKHFKR